jgi:hypothetical protein
VDEITVGPSGTDIVGADNRAIQLAVDALALRGGGTVRVQTGEYLCSDSVHLRTNVRLVGEGDRTVLRRAPMVIRELALDADIGQQQATPRDATAFRPGMGVMFCGQPGAPGSPARPLTIARVEGNTLYFDDYLMANFEAQSGSLICNYFALIRGYDVRHAQVEGFTVDASADDVSGIEEIRIGGVWLTLCQDCEVRHLKVSGALGDGLLSEPGQRVSFAHCESWGNSHHGLHLGSHSPWSRASHCHLYENGSDGLYLCWGVRESMVRGNEIHHNGFGLHRNGLSLGHKDTDNLIEHNRIYANAKHGVCFRKETEGNGAHRNLLRENLIENNGTPAAEVPERFHADPRRELQYAGVFVNGATHDLRLERNQIRETRSGAAALQLNAVYLGKGVRRVAMVGNAMAGHPGAAVVDESGSGDHRLQTEPAAGTHAL